MCLHKERVSSCNCCISVAVQQFSYKGVSPRVEIELSSMARLGTRSAPRITDNESRCSTAFSLQTFGRVLI